MVRLLLIVTLLAVGVAGFFAYTNVQTKIGNLESDLDQATTDLTTAQEAQAEAEKDRDDFEKQANDDYLFKINELYVKLRNECSKLDFCYDISCIAIPSGNNYSDIRHHNKNGNQIILDSDYVVNQFFNFVFYIYR